MQNTELTKYREQMYQDWCNNELLDEDGYCEYINWELVDKIISICQKDELETADVVELSKLGTNDVPDWLYSCAEDVFYSIMHRYADDWDDYNPIYPDNPYLFGYELDGHVFITGYTGVAGCYWNGNSYYDGASFICKP